MNPMSPTARSLNASIARGNAIKKKKSKISPLVRPEILLVVEIAISSIEFGVFFCGDMAELIPVHYSLYGGHSKQKQKQMRDEAPLFLKAVGAEAGARRYLIRKGHCCGVPGKRSRLSKSLLSPTASRWSAGTTL